jgi:hypothetical protein
MNNQETQATLDTGHKTKTNKEKNKKQQQTNKKRIANN